MSLDLIFVKEFANSAPGIITDVELEFIRYKVPRNSLTAALISEIEQGTWFDDNTFLDRFGQKLPIGMLSTGCKAALLTAFLPTRVISMCEAGANAISSVIRNVQDGSITLVWDGIPFGGNSDTVINITVFGNLFVTLGELNEYLDSSEFTWRYANV